LRCWSWDPSALPRSSPPRRSSDLSWLRGPVPPSPLLAHLDPGSESQQRLVCESATRNSGGASVRQRSMTLGQRGWNAHPGGGAEDRKSTRLNSSHLGISYAVFCLK